MIKKLMMLCVAAMAAMGTFAATETVNGVEWEYREGSDSVEVTGIPTETTGSVTIPAMLGGRPVKRIGDGAFEDCCLITSITIPDSVITIEDWVFSGCSSLNSIQVGENNLYYKSVGGFLYSKDGTKFIACPGGKTRVVIPDGVTCIGMGAFDSCKLLTSVSIPGSVKTIESYAFCECSSLMDVTIPNSVTSMGESVFEWCWSLETVTVGNGVVGIGEYTFANCISLIDVTIGHSVESIGESAFDGCLSLPRIMLPNNVKIIGSGAFMFCRELASVTLPNGITSIEDYVFSGCQALNDIIIPQTVTTIGDGAFDTCRSLTSITIPNSVMNIGDDAFRVCESLTKILFEGDAPSIGYNCFWNANYKCTAYVSRGTAGWGVEIPGTWNNIKIEYKDTLSLECDVSFDANGGELAENNRTVKKGSAIGALPSPVRSKYKFLGWYTATEGGTKISATTKVTSDVTYYAQWVYDGSVTVSAYVADGCEAMGKVTGGKTAKAGTKVTLKAKANRGYVFAGWNGPIDDTVNPLNPSLSYVVGEDDAEFVAYFIPVSDDWVDVWLEMDSEYTTGEEISDIYVEVESGSLATIKVKGLPSGLKFTAKAIYDRDGELLHDVNTIYGTPKKSGVYTVTVTATTAGKKTDTCSAVIVVRKDGERMVKITAPTWYDDETDMDVIPGKVTGAGIYAEGKKATLKATANKGFVFVGWRDVNSGDWVYGVEDYRSPSLSYIMTDSDMEIEAVFEPVEYDDTIVAYVDGNEITSNANDNNFVADGRIILPIQIESHSLPKAAVSGLPAGMKYTDKALTVKATKTEEAYNVPANAIYGTPTKPGLYTVTVKLTNQSIKKAIEKKFTVEVPNLTAADHLFREDGEYYIANDIGDKYSIYVGVTEFELPKIRLNGAGTLKVSRLPSGLKYNARTGTIEGIATKEGNYTVFLTVGGLVSTFTIEVKPLPDWVVGTFEGCGFDDPDFDGSRNIWTISKQGKVSCKSYCSDGNALIQETEQAPLTTFVDGVFVIQASYKGYDKWGSYRGGGTYYISRSEVNGVEFGVAEGDYWGEETSSYGDYWEWEGKDYAVQNIWSKDTERDFLPEIYNGAEKEIDLTGWNEKTFDESNYWSEPVDGCSLRLKFGKNGAVTAAFYEPGASKATGTASATLMPYDRDGDTVQALLTIAIAPKGRHSITLALYLDIDTSRGIVYGDDIEVVDYLMEAE